MSAGTDNLDLMLWCYRAVAVGDWNGVVVVVVAEIEDSTRRFSYPNIEISCNRRVETNQIDCPRVSNVGFGGKYNKTMLAKPPHSVDSTAYRDSQ
ncbi:hypothetical protein SNE40_004531 [Patella caerulea]|uniref:Uncharacterized protein n=1 Tax=Patella caerulea TaxID=87958 RepID=A0AAN8JYA6_PATCE